MGAGIRVGGREFEADTSGSGGTRRTVEQERDQDNAQGDNNDGPNQAFLELLFHAYPRYADPALAGGEYTPSHSAAGPTT